MEVLQKTADYVICRKAPGEISEHTPDKTGLPDRLEAEYGVTVYPVHRLDCTTGGLMVYALNPRMAADLSAQIQDGRFGKTYLAVVHGSPVEKSGIWEDELFFDRRKGKAFVADKKRNGTKSARLQYEVLEEREENGGVSLCRVELFTGRTHQIRVQFGSRKHPLLGDGKYGSRSNQKDCALWSWRLTFREMATGEVCTFTDVPPANRAFGLFTMDTLY